MATKPKPRQAAWDTTATLNIVRLDLDYGARLLIPNHILTQFADLMSLCSVVKPAGGLNRSNAGVYYVSGDVDYGTAKVGHSIIAPDHKTGDEFVKFHNAHVELAGITEYQNHPHVTLDEFYNAPTEPEGD